MMRFARVVLAYLVLCSAAFAQVGQIPTYLQPAPSGGGTPFSIAQTATTSTTTGTIGTNTFSSLSIGTANTTRIVSVSVCHGPNNATLTAFTIGGVTATQATGSRQNSTGGVVVEIWYAPVPTGTTATVQFDQGVSDARIVIGVYRIVGTTAAFSAGGGALSGTASALSASVSIPVGGGAMAAVMTHSATSGSGTPTNLTLDTNNLVVGTSTSYIGTNTTNSGATSMGVSWAGATDAALSIATFSP